jgi:hypothetical protein
MKFSRTVEIYSLDIPAHPKINSWLRPWLTLSTNLIMLGFDLVDLQPWMWKEENI